MDCSVEGCWFESQFRIAGKEYTVAVRLVFSWSLSLCVSRVLSRVAPLLFSLSS
ncbi:UNVERIFIED_CONTAM: hypothetical protein FKN15_014856 [Acipenser sinensis]